VNIASRLQALAPPSGIYVSQTVQRDLANKNDIRTEFVRSENLKNVKDPIQVYEIFSGASEKGGPKNEAKIPVAVPSSILPGYDFDIHVSYRFNDNKYDGWVTKFVEKLNQELSATLKDKLSIFFDKEPEEQRKEYGTRFKKNQIADIYSHNFSNILRCQFAGMEKRVQRIPTAIKGGQHRHVH
jgi:hypothetical protein